jgi:hypothetical protein
MVTVTGVVGGWHLVGALLLASITSVAAAGTAFVVVMAPALKSMERASLAAEKAAANTEKAMEEFEKLNRQTQTDLPKTLAEMEAAGKEWDELGAELRVLLQKVEGWGQWGSAEEALTKITAAALEEPTRAIAEFGKVGDEAGDYLKRVSDDLLQAMTQLTSWDRDLKASVEAAAWSEAWEEKKDGSRGAGGKLLGGSARQQLEGGVGVKGGARRPAERQQLTEDQAVKGPPGLDLRGLTSGLRGAGAPAPHPRGGGSDDLAKETGRTDLDDEADRTAAEARRGRVIEAQQRKAGGLLRTSARPTVNLLLFLRAST